MHAYMDTFNVIIYMTKTNQISPKQFIASRFTYAVVKL